MREGRRAVPGAPIPRGDDRREPGTIPGRTDAAFVPIDPNPYIVGNPVRGRAMFFGREAEFELVRRRFQGSTRGGLLVFCGERRSGKTSILFQILDGRLGPDFIPVLIDMQSMAVANELEFLTRVSEEVLEALGPGDETLGPPAFAPDANHSAVFQRFVREVLRRHPEKKLILLFDEYELFENKIDGGLLSPDVLHVLAGLIESHPVFVVFTGSQHLEQRRREYWKILGKSLHKMISFLERDDAVSLIRRPVEGRVRYGEDAVGAIWRLTAGQPFYTQAICQSLVDLLNERHTNEVSHQILADVVDGIVNNPLPQMIFMWDGLERSEKLVLSLLAEQLDDAGAHAGGDDLMRRLRRRQYPVDLDKARVATTLEKLFKSEMLLRSDRGRTHEYAFRMDLWRLWIRRQHSVWQVMREEGLEIRKRFAGRVRTTGTLVGVAAVLIAFPLVYGALRGGHPRRPTGGMGIGPFLLEAEPADAMVFLDGDRIGAAPFRGPIAVGREHRFRLSAPGFADTEIVLSIGPGDSVRRRVALRELFGGLRVETRPPGAEVELDGRPAGRSPVTLSGLSAVRPHAVVARLEGFDEERSALDVRADTTISAVFALRPLRADLLVTTEPPDCDIRVDGGRPGPSPLRVELLVGRHEISASKAGHVAADTTLLVAAGSGRVHLTLAPEPPGFLVVKGDRPAEIWIGGTLIVANVQNSGVRSLAPGPHQVRVVFPDGEARDQTVTVKSRERATYDYTSGTVTRRSQEAP